MSNCEGCSNDIPNAIEIPNRISMIKREGFPEGKNGPLKLQDGATHTNIWSIYTGGLAEHHLIGIILTLPEDYQRIQVHPDGSLEYEKGLDDWESPSPIDGYVRDSENKWLFHPLWESCIWRQYSTILKSQCKCIEVIAKCDQSFNWVKFEDCQQCKARVPADLPITIKKKTIKNLRLPDLDHNPKITKPDRA